MSAKQNKLRKQLKEVLTNEPDTLRAEVAKEALQHDEIETFFSDLLQHGCQSGMIGKLIYYHDTQKFYDKYYNEIEDLRYELESSLGTPLQPKGDLKNWYAWLAFEETARAIADEINIDW